MHFFITSRIRKLNLQLLISHLFQKPTKFNATSEDAKGEETIRLFHSRFYMYF